MTAGKTGELIEGLKQKVEKLKEFLINFYKSKPLKAVFSYFNQIVKKYPCLDKLTEILRIKSRRLLSIDFGEGFVKIIYVESERGQFKLLNYDLKKLPSIKDNREEIINFINSFLKANSIPEKEVYLTISDPDSIVINDVTLPVIPRREVKEALKWQLKGELSFDWENALFDWQVIKEYADEEGVRRNDILFVSAKRETIDECLSLINACNLYPVRISSAPFNYASILKYQGKTEYSTQAVLDLGHRKSVLCIYKDNKLNFMRILPFSSDKLTHSLASTLFSDSSEIELSYQKAERIKEDVGIPYEDIILEGSITTGQVRSLMRLFLEDLVKELRRSFNYFATNYKEEPPAFLYITGGGSKLKNLDEYLSNELNIKVRKFLIPENIDTQAITRERLDKIQDQIINATGAVLAVPGDINLLPPEIEIQRLEFIEKVSLRLLAVAIGLILLSSFFFVKLQIKDYRNRLMHSKVHLQTIKEIKVLRQQNILIENLIDKIQKDKVPVDGLLKVVSNLMPNNIVLDELLLGQDKHVLILRGVVTQETGTPGSTITSFMEKIEGSSFFSEASLVSSKRVAGAYSFEIKCDLAR